MQANVMVEEEGTTAEAKEKKFAGNNGEGGWGLGIYARRLALALSAGVRCLGQHNTTEKIDS